MKIFKSKSLDKSVSDFDILNGTHSIRFISFERAVDDFGIKYKVKEKPTGYRVTDQGIEIIYD